MSEELAARVDRHLDETDRRRNATLQSLSSIRGQLGRIEAERERIDTVVDLGCGSGSFVAALGAELDAREIHGVERQEKYRTLAADRGVTVHDLDLECDRLPFADGDVDLVLALGLFEHLRWYDHTLEEMRRILRGEGMALLTVPNLGSYLNRLALLCGFQPRNVELSERRAVGLLPGYPHDKPIGHVHAPTRRALIELVECSGFDVESTAGLTPYQDGRLVRLLDATIGRHPSLARRLSLLASRQSRDRN